MTPLIEVYADIWCPFAHVGLRALDEHRRRSGHADVAIRARAWPLELVNDAAMEPAKTLAHVEHLRAQVAPTMFLDVATHPFPTSTIDALALVERAYAVDARLGERVSFEVRDALFEEGLDISDRAVLDRLATARWGLDPVCDADRDLVIQSWHEGQVRGVRGSPHFFCGEKESFCPSLQITNDPEDGVRIELDARRLGEFLDECFAQAERRGVRPPRASPGRFT